MFQVLQVDGVENTPAGAALLVHSGPTSSDPRGWQSERHSAGPPAEVRSGQVSREPSRLELFGLDVLRAHPEMSTCCEVSPWRGSVSRRNLLPPSQMAELGTSWRSWKVTGKLEHQ